MTTETLDHLRSQLSAASDYPHEVEHFTFESQQQELSMAYMDVVAQSKDSTEQGQAPIQILPPEAAPRLTQPR